MIDIREVNSNLQSEAFEACKEANVLAKRIFERVSNEKDVNIEVEVLEIKDILNCIESRTALLYTVNDIDNFNISGKIENTLNKEIESNKKYNIDVQACMESYPSMSLHVNPGALKDSFGKVRERIKLHFQRHSDEQIFVSDPIIKFNSVFFFILKLNKEFFCRFVVLPPVREYHGTWLTSFINQIIDILFDYWRESMYFQLKYSTTSLEMSDDEIIRLAAMDMTQGRELPELGIFSKISSQNYEGRNCRGRIAFINDESEIDDYIIFEDVIAITEKNVRHIRKLLEMTGESYYLCAKKHMISGFGRIVKNSNIQSIEFLGYAKWRLLYQDKEILRSHNGEIILPKNKFDRENFIKILDVCFQDKKRKNDFEYLARVVEMAIKQKHGTMILISSEAGKEAIRLCNNGRGTKIKPTKLNEDSIEKLSSIDGSLMMDLDGKCHGIGIIIDGLSKVKGSPERGARYNSAKDYIYYRNRNSKKKCIAIVISEDKSIDIIK